MHMSINQKKHILPTARSFEACLIFWFVPFSWALKKVYFCMPCRIFCHERWERKIVLFLASSLSTTSSDRPAFYVFSWFLSLLVHSTIGDWILTVKSCLGAASSDRIFSCIAWFCIETYWSWCNNGMTFAIFWRFAFSFLPFKYFLSNLS